MEPCTLYAAFGGLFINGLSLLELYSVPKEQRPDFRDPLYWLPFLAWPVIGGVLALAYKESQTALSPILAINVGASAPLIIRSMISAAPFARQPIQPKPGA